MIAPLLFLVLAPKVIEITSQLGTLKSRVSPITKSLSTYHPLAITSGSYELLKQSQSNFWESSFSGFLRF